MSAIHFLPPSCINLYLFTMKLLKLVTMFSIQAENYALSSSLEDATGILLELKESQLGWSDMRPNAMLSCWMWPEYFLGSKGNGGKFISGNWLASYMCF